jgi:hypothetical protein
VLEAAVLVERLGMLTRRDRAGSCLPATFAIDKTAGRSPVSGLRWLLQAIERHHPGLHLKKCRSPLEQTDEPYGCEATLMRRPFKGHAGCRCSPAEEVRHRAAPFGGPRQISLLASVRDLEEAREAATAGADLID